MKVYRVVNPDAPTGLWYNKDGSWNPVITQILQGGAKSAGLPMGFDPEMVKDGHAWLSATTRKEELLDWFSIDDLVVLSTMGYGIWEFDVTFYREVPGHVVIVEDAILSATRIPLISYLEEVQNHRMVPA